MTYQNHSITDAYKRMRTPIFESAVMPYNGDRVARNLRNPRYLAAIHGFHDVDVSSLPDDHQHKQIYDQFTDADKAEYAEWKPKFDQR